MTRVERWLELKRLTDGLTALVTANIELDENPSRVDAETAHDIDTRVATLRKRIVNMGSVVTIDRLAADLRDKRRGGVVKKARKQ